MGKEQRNKIGGEANDIEPGMMVEATDGDMGDADVSKPKVVDVVHDEQNNVDKVIVEKGVIFKKEIEVPADRIQEIDHEKEDGVDGSDGSHAKIVVDAHETELEALPALGHDQLVSEEALEKENSGLLDQVEQVIPTTEGLREMEAGIDARQEEPLSRLGPRAVLRQLGPGLLGGLSGNDPSAVTSYAITGAQTGFGQLWLMLLSTPLYIAILYTCAKIGRITQKGFSEVLREYYSRWIALPAALILIISNVALITADLVAVGSGFSLITGFSYKIFMLPVALMLWYLTVFRDFESIKRIFIVMSLAFVAYIITGLLVKPDWGQVLYNTFVPHLNFDFTSISSATALLGATLSPYTMFWQVQGEKEEQRPGSVKQKLHFAMLDIASGGITGNLIAYFIIIVTATTLFTQHKSIATAADAATALVPIAGPFAKYLFAIGLIGSGLIAIPILLASTSYAVAGSFGWPAGLSKKPWQNEGFYLILSAALIVSLVMAFVGVDPIHLIFWSNILAGVLVPILIVYLLIIGNSRKVMGTHRLSWFTNLWLILAVLITVIAALLLFYGIFTGQGGS